MSSFSRKLLEWTAPLHNRGGLMSISAMEWVAGLSSAECSFGSQAVVPAFSDNFRFAPNERTPPGTDATSEKCQLQKLRLAGNDALHRRVPDYLWQQ